MSERHPMQKDYLLSPAYQWLTSTSEGQEVFCLYVNGAISTWQLMDKYLEAQKTR